MDRKEFEQLRKLPQKEIEADIEFVSAKEMPSHIVVFERAEITNSLGYSLTVSGQYNRKTKRVTYTFWVDGVGMICRVCVNGAVHGEAGRTHKHDLTDEGDRRATCHTLWPGRTLMARRRGRYGRRFVARPGFSIQGALLTRKVGYDYRLSATF